MEKWKKRVYDKYASTMGQSGKMEEEMDKTIAPRLPYIESIIHKHIPSKRQTRIVDVGCGDGTWLYILKQKGYENISGADVSQEQVKLAREKGVEEVEIADGQGYLEGMASNTVDVVLMIDVLEHLTRQELFDTADEVYRVLSGGGRCIAHVPNAGGIFSMDVRYGDLTHEVAFTPSSVKQLYSTVGFSGVSCFEDKPVPHGFVSFLRRIVWEVGTVPFRLLEASETGNFDAVLSRNMIAIAVK